MASSAPTTMRAWTYTHPLPSGTLSSALKLSASTPAPASDRLLKAGELRIKVLAMSLNPADHRVAELPLVGKFAVTTPASTGMDFCGRVIGGKGKHGLTPMNANPLAGPPFFFEHEGEDPIVLGDMVFGKLPGPTQFGTMAEVTIIESKYVAKVTKGNDQDWKTRSREEKDDIIAQFAALPTAGLTAWQAAGFAALPFAGPTTWQAAGPTLSQPAPVVFVNGGASGTGHLAIRFIRHRHPDAHIVSTASPRNIDFVKSLGVDAVIDYTTTPSLSDALLAHSLTIGKRFDRIIDCIGGDSALYSRSSAFLESSKDGGAFVQVGAKTSFGQAGIIIKNMLLSGWSWITGRQGAAYSVMMVATTSKDLRALDAMANAGVKVEIQKIYEMEEGKEALEMVQSGKTRGKVVVMVARE